MHQLSKSLLSHHQCPKRLWLALHHPQLAEISAATQLAFDFGHEVNDMRDVPDRLLSRQQLRVKEQTLSGQAFFDAEGAAKDLGKYRLPALFLDFETVQFAVLVIGAWFGPLDSLATKLGFNSRNIPRGA